MCRTSSASQDLGRTHGPTSLVEQRHDLWVVQRCLEELTERELVVAILVHISEDLVQLSLWCRLVVWDRAGVFHLTNHPEQGLQKCKIKKLG